MGLETEGIWQNPCVPEAVKGVSAILSRSSGSAIDNDPFSSPLPIRHPRPTVARASTSATLVHVGVDFVSSGSPQKPKTNNFKSADFVDCFRERLYSKSVASVEENPEQYAPAVNGIPPPMTVQRRRGNKRVSKMAARWTPNPLERGFLAHCPATGVERLTRLQRLNLVV